MTFRLRAPEAKKVTVAGDFGNDVDLRAGEDGILETDGRNRPRFALASCGVLRFQALDGADAIESRVAGLPDLTHPAAPERREDFIGAKAASPVPS